MEHIGRGVAIDMFQENVQAHWIQEDFNHVWCPLPCIPWIQVDPSVV